MKIYKATRTVHFINYRIINEYTVCHLFLVVIFEEFIEKFFKILPIRNSGVSDKNIKYPLIEFLFFFLSIIIFLIQLFAIFVFHEFIELNCFELNKNTKKNIIKRQEQDSLLIQDEIDNDDLFDDENEEEKKEEEQKIEIIEKQNNL